MSKGAAKSEPSPAPQPRASEDIRNVVLVGPGGAGKSTLFDHLVATRVPGRRPQEGDRDRSVGLSVASFASNDMTVNLVDAPGFPDFVGELRAGLRAADAAIFVISAADEIDGATALLWQELAAVGVPRAIAVSKLDLPRSDYDDTIARCQRVFGDAQALYLPVHDATGPSSGRSGCSARGSSTRPAAPGSSATPMPTRRLRSLTTAARSSKPSSRSPRTTPSSTATSRVRTSRPTRSSTTSRRPSPKPPSSPWSPSPRRPASGSRRSSRSSSSASRRPWADRCPRHTARWGPACPPAPATQPVLWSPR